jgi:hypothetical protein
VSVWPRRDAVDQLVKSGMIASASTGEAMASARRVGRSTGSRAIVTGSFAMSIAIDSQTATRPSAAQTPQDEKLQR